MCRFRSVCLPAAVVRGLYIHTPLILPFSQSSCSSPHSITKCRHLIIFHSYCIPKIILVSHSFIIVRRTAVARERQCALLKMQWKEIAAPIVRCSTEKERCCSFFLPAENDMRLPPQRCPCACRAVKQIVMQKFDSLAAAHLLLCVVLTEIKMLPLEDDGKSLTRS